MGDSRVIGATEFKAKCLALLDEINADGGTITITKRGQAIAVLQPVATQKWTSPKGTWAGKLQVTGDIVNLDSAAWDVLK